MPSISFSGGGASGGAAGASAASSALPRGRRRRRRDQPRPGLSRHLLRGQGAAPSRVQVGFFTQVQGFSRPGRRARVPRGRPQRLRAPLPTRIKQGNITLKRGITKETALLEWFKKSVVKVKPANMSITLYDSAGKTVQAWSFAQRLPGQVDRRPTSTRAATRS